ncbi:hypothetical protein L249_2789 [Ophiocordyceps polyrhachis-furcata BCC 54312]|uniref:Uncharacterized protein n=1 Tax=Ophiocordyceps polyrhachis-furcata BCC 54312 TaxID=1330021 RepID=A0A367LQQ4_9HYPO|nr:hypothetical protein L249_2789 [Ophiocordyceps polyrhachis-furcata BCC 54312]
MCAHRYRERWRFGVLLRVVRARTEEAFVNCHISRGRLDCLSVFDSGGPWHVSCDAVSVRLGQDKPLSMDINNGDSKIRDLGPPPRRVEGEEKKKKYDDGRSCGRRAGRRRSRARSGGLTHPHDATTPGTLHFSPAQYEMIRQFTRWEHETTQQTGGGGENNPPRLTNQSGCLLLIALCGGLSIAYPVRQGRVIRESSGQIHILPPKPFYPLHKLREPASIRTTVGLLQQTGGSHHESHGLKQSEAGISGPRRRLWLPKIWQTV